MAFLTSVCTVCGLQGLDPHKKGTVSSFWPTGLMVKAETNCRFGVPAFPPDLLAAGSAPVLFLVLRG